MNFTFRPHRLLAVVVTLSLVALLTLSVNADYFEEAFNSSNPVTLGDNDVLVIKSTDENSRYTYNNYSGSGSVYLSLERLSFFNTNIPSEYTNPQVFIVGSALGLPDLGLDESSNPKTSSSVFGAGRILVLTNELPTADGTATVNEGALFNDNGSTPIYDNPIQIKGVGGIRVGWNANLTVSGKISDYTDANGAVTPGKLIIESDSSDIRILNGANDYSGGTQISGGNSAYGAGALTQTVQVDGTPYGTGPISFGANGSVLALNDHTITVGGFDGGMTGTVSGADTLTINIGANNYSAPVTINNVANLTVIGTGSQTVAATDVTDLTISSGEMGFSGALNVPGSITIASGATLKMTGTGSSLNAGNQVKIRDGATLYFEDAVPRNGTYDLAINVEEGGTLKFYETNTVDHNDYNSLVRDASKNVTITGDGSFIKTGTGKLFMTYNGNSAKLAIVLSDKAVIDVQEGDLVNGGWNAASWKYADGSAYNQATLNVGPNGTIDLWDGTMHVGGITGNVDGENAGLIMSKNNGHLVVGMSMTDADKSFVYNGNVTLNGGRSITKEGKTTQVFAGEYNNLGTTAVNDGVLEISGTATLGTATVNGGKLEISSSNATLTTTNLNGGSLDVSGTVNLETVNFADGGKLNVIQNGVATFTKATNLNQYTNITVDNTASLVVDPGNDGEQAVAQSQSGEFNINGKVTVKSGYFRVVNVPNTATIELDGGTLQNNGNNTGTTDSVVNSNVILTSDSNLMAGWSGTLTVNGVVSGPGKLIIRNDSGDVYLNNTNTHTGGTQIGDNYKNPNARLIMGADNALGTGPIYFGASNSKLDMVTYSQVFNGIDNQNGSGGNFTGDTIVSSYVFESPTFNAPEGTNFIYTGTMPASTGTLTKVGAGSQVLGSADVENIAVTEGTLGFSGVLNATGDISFPSGTTFKMYGTASALNAANPIVVQNGAALYFENAVPRNDNTDLAINIEEGGTLTFYETDAGDHNNNNALVRDASKNVTITGDGDFIKTGPGKLFITVNGNSGKVAIVLSDKAVIDVQEGDLVNGGWSPNCWKYSDNSAYNQATLNVGPNGTVDLWDGTMNVGGITGDIDGDNHGLIMSKNNGHLVVGMGMDAEKTFVYNGDLTLNENRSFTKEGETTQKFTGTYYNLGVTNANNGTLEFSGNTTLGTVNFNGDGKIDVTGGTLTFAKSINLTPTIPLTIDSDVVVIADPGNNGEQVVAQAYNDSGATPLKLNNRVIVRSGYFRTVNVSSDTKLELDGGTLQNNGNNTGTSTSTINTDILLTSDSRLMAGWNGRMDVNGVISGPGMLIIRDDSGTIYLNKSNTYTGGTQVGDNYNSGQPGRLVAGAENVLGTGRLYFIKDNSFFDMKGYAQTIGGLGKDMSADEVQYKGSVNNSGAETTLTINVPEGETYNYTGAVANNISIVKTGAGTQQFNLEQNATFAKEILVTNGRLDMKEYYTGLLTVKSGGVFSPGNSIGTLNLTGDFNLDGGTLLMEIGGPTAADSDQLIINGNLLLNDGDIVLQFLDGMTPNAEFAVVLDADNSGDLDVLSLIDSYYFSGLSYGLIDGLWTLSGKIDPNAVPEPSTWALLVLGVIGLLFWRKRK